MRIHLLDVEFDTLTIPDLFDTVSNTIQSGERIYMGTHNLHSIYLFARDSQFRRFYAEARTVHIDGMSLVYIARLFGFPVRREHRVTYLDWIFPLMETSAQRGWRVFYLGGKPGVAEKASQRLKQRFPELHLDTHHGYFEKTTAENDLVVEKINSYRPNILMVGMGMPIEEHWVLNNSSRIHPCVIMVPGACFDYIAGAVAMPPRWMGRIGLEWLFRLASEPRRLWRRYLVEPWYILVLIVKELFR